MHTIQATVPDWPAARALFQLLAQQWHDTPGDRPAIGAALVQIAGEAEPVRFSYSPQRELWAVDLQEVATIAPAMG